MSDLLELLITTSSTLTLPAVIVLVLSRVISPNPATIEPTERGPVEVILVLPALGAYVSEAVLVSPGSK